MITMMTINVATDDGADTDDDYNYQYYSIGTPDEAPQRELKFKKVGTLDDRSELSDEMVDLCKRLPFTK